ncbi:MAG: AAA family ATPase [Roseburia sp.]|nr:AAA family ATPase [Roseburia sp.]
MVNRKAKLPIGIENFKEIRTQEFYYVDKTGLIADLLYNWGKVNLFTRPRRFGKTLNMSMLKCFFEIGCDQTLFDGLTIAKETELCDTYMGKFPVISISLKGVSGKEFAAARAMLCNVIAREALRFQFLLESDRLSQVEKQQYMSLTARGEKEFSMTDAELMNSLRTLSALLEKHYDHKVIILVDEYDVPLDKAMHAGYYEDMIDLIRNFLSEALKTNDSLYFAVLTGCLRVSKESIFTGLNNLNVLSIMDVEFDEHFGFMDSEVKEMLEYYQFSEAYDAVKEWYDGYRFGNVDVYCPWDVICYCNKLRADREAVPEAYWSNTSGNDIIRRFIDMADATTKMEIEKLMAGEAIEKEIHKELTYKDLYDSIDNLWSVLFLTGYLTKRGRSAGDKLMLAIPNQEIRKIFESQILKWFHDTVRKDGATLNQFCETFQRGDAAGIEEQFNDYLWNTISIRDIAVKGKKENFYHGILLGLLRYKENWELSSNQESGDGYSDIIIRTGKERIGIIIEVKYAKNGDLEKGCVEALEQIETNNYEEELRKNGMRIILKYGIACYKKRCMVVLAEEING